MEDDLKILKVGFISNHLLDPTHISNLSLQYQVIVYKTFKWRRPSMEDDQQYLKWNTSATTYRILLKFLTYAYTPKPYFTNL